MVNATNFWLAWAIYLLAGMLFFTIYWRITHLGERRLLSYCLRAVMLALIATPWYVSDTAPVMAPAIIIVFMDAVTISGEAAVRAFVPLFLSTTLALVVALLTLLLRRNRRSGQDKPA